MGVGPHPRPHSSRRGEKFGVLGRVFNGQGSERKLGLCYIILLHNLKHIAGIFVVGSGCCQCAFPEWIEGYA